MQPIEMQKTDQILVYLRSKIVPHAMVSPNFAWHEFFCKCDQCDAQPFSHGLVYKLEDLRAALDDNPITITSGYRCPAHNKAVGGAKKSRHMIGDAADIKVHNKTPYQVGATAKMIGFTGIKVYKSWTHVDLRPGATWFDGV